MATKMAENMHRHTYGPELLKYPNFVALRLRMRSSGEKG
jgi:hypothetical protein